MLQLTLVLVCVVCGSVRADDVLEWESKKGHKTRATFEGLEVVITKEDGQKIRVPFNALSVETQQQALRLIKEAEVPEVKEEPGEVKQPDVLSPVRLQKLLGEIKEIKRQAKLQGSTARNSLFLKEEMSKLDKRVGKFKVKFAFLVEDVFQTEGLYKLELDSPREGPWGPGCGLYMERGVMYIRNYRGDTAVFPEVTKQEMMEIGKGTHQYEVICEMSASDLSRITHGDPSPPVKQADCKLAKIPGGDRPLPRQPDRRPRVGF